MPNTREEAWELLKEYNQEPFHLQHGLTVEGCLRYFARELGYGEEEDFWGLVGLLHDLDFEKYPEQHCRKEAEILKEKGWDDRLIHAVASHGWPRCSDVEPKEEMEKGPLCGGRTVRAHRGAALMRPSKSVQDMEVKSLKKKFKDKHFSRRLQPDVIQQGRTCWLGSEQTF